MSAFCDICPDGESGFWLTGHSAWRACFENKKCMRVFGGDLAEKGYSEVPGDQENAVPLPQGGANGT
jgi:hypothetical protein